MKKNAAQQGMQWIVWIGPNLTIAELYFKKHNKSFLLLIFQTISAKHIKKYPNSLALDLKKIFLIAN